MSGFRSLPPPYYMDGANILLLLHSGRLHPWLPDHKIEIEGAIAGLRVTDPTKADQLYDMYSKKLKEYEEKNPPKPPEKERVILNPGELPPIYAPDEPDPVVMPVATVVTPAESVPVSNSVPVQPVESSVEVPVKPSKKRGRPKKPSHHAAVAVVS